MLLFGAMVDGTPIQVKSPNGAGSAGTTASITLHVADPKLSLTKEVCTATDPAACDPADAAVWAPSATIASGSDVVWRLTAKNDGNIALNDVAVAADVLDGTSATNDCVGASVVATLAPGVSASIVCKTTDVTGSTATNYAKLTSTFTDPSPDGSLAPRFPNGVESNVAQAKVIIPNPALGLVKEVCATGTGCDVADNSQWVPRVTVPLGMDAQWRLTATNTGNVDLKDVVVSSEELSGGKTGASAECGALTFGDLVEGASKSVTCTTASITDTTQDTVNTAGAHGTPVDANGVPMPQFPSGIDSPTAHAAVATSAFIVNPVVTNPPAGSPQAAGTPSGDSLAQTGLDTGLVSALAAMLLLAGGAFLVVRRRRAVRA